MAKLGRGVDRVCSACGSREVTALITTTHRKLTRMVPVNDFQTPVQFEQIPDTVISHYCLECDELTDLIPAKEWF
jgi:hypothetical protein